jgi:type IX secretion system PorP/SprF family membrane protein
MKFIDEVQMNLQKTFYLIILVSSLSIHNNSAQQLSHFSLSSINKYQFNPAVSAFDNTMVITGIHRNQWTDIAGAPSTQHFNAYMPFDYGISSVGIQIVSDAIGVENSLSLALSYAQMFNFEWGKLSLGVQAGAEQKRIDQSLLRTPGGFYGEDQLDHRDPILGSNDISSLIPIFGLSSWITFRGFEGGLSLRQLSPIAHFSDESMSYRSKAEYSAFVDYFMVLDEGLFLIPSFHLYTDLSKFQTWTHVLVGLNNQYFGGLGIRGYSPSSIDAIGLAVGMRLNDRFVFYYNYDIGLSEIYQASGSTHELMLVYRKPAWKSGRQRPPVIYNPRFLE